MGTLTSGQWITVALANGKLQAEIIKSLLEDQGIPVLLAGEAAGYVYGLTRGPLAEVKVLVPAEKSLEAKRILQSHAESNRQ